MMGAAAGSESDSESAWGTVTVTEGAPPARPGPGPWLRLVTGPPHPAVTVTAATIATSILEVTSQCQCAGT